jgi:hypothetical protein
LILALSDAGAWVARSGELPAGVFGVPGESLMVDGVAVACYEYLDVAARQSVAQAISPDGARIAGQPIAWRDRPHIWSTGRLLVVYEGTDGPTVLLLAAVLGNPITSPGPAQEEPYPPAVTAAISALALDLGIAPGEVEVLDFSEGQWPDACLGLAGPGEVCAMVITPGWRISLRAEGRDFAARTDMLGGLVRWEH